MWHILIIMDSDCVHQFGQPEKQGTGNGTGTGMGTGVEPASN